MIAILSGGRLSGFDSDIAAVAGRTGSATETISIYASIRGFRVRTSYVGAMVVVLIVLLSAVLMFALKRMEIAR